MRSLLSYNLTFPVIALPSELTKDVFLYVAHAPPTFFVANDLSQENDNDWDFRPHIFPVEEEAGRAATLVVSLSRYNPVVLRRHIMIKGGSTSPSILSRRPRQPAAAAAGGATFDSMPDISGVWSVPATGARGKAAGQGSWTGSKGKGRGKKKKGGAVRVKVEKEEKEWARAFAAADSDYSYNSDDTEPNDDSSSSQTSSSKGSSSSDTSDDDPDSDDDFVPAESV